MIARENQEVVGVVSGEVSCGLPDGVGRTLEPVRALRGLLRRQHLDEAIREEVQAVGLCDVPIEGSRVELRQDEDPLQARVKGVADRDVDQPVFAADRHGGLRPHVRQRIQPGSSPAAQDQGQDVVHRSHLTCAGASPQAENLLSCN